MKRSLQHALLLLSFGLFINSCGTGPEKRQYNYEWADFGLLQGEVTGTSLVAYGNRVIVGTDKGIQFLVVGNEQQWTNSNLQGVKITSLVLNPLLTNTIIATADPNYAGNTLEDAYPVYLSSNGGTTWTPLSNGLLDEDSGNYPTVTDITFKVINQLEQGQQYVDFYLALNGSAIARTSFDRLGWTVIKGDLTTNDPATCHLSIAQSFYTYLYQGCELPNNQTYIERIDLNSDTYDVLPAGTRILSETEVGAKPVVGMNFSLFTDGLSYGLLKGGLVAVIQDQWRWVYQYPPSGNNQGMNTVMTALWIDPTDFNHLVFGGFEEGNSTAFSLYDTDDHGKTFRLIDPPPFLGLNAPKIRGSYEAGLSARNMLLLVSGVDSQSQTRTRVFSRNQVDPD